MKCIFRDLGMFLLTTSCLTATAFSGDQTAHWSVGAGNWNDAANWSTSPDVPNNDDQTFDVRIVSGAEAVTLDFTAEIESLRVAGVQMGQNDDFARGGKLEIIRNGSLTSQNGTLGVADIDAPWLDGTATGTVTLKNGATWSNSEWLSVGRGGRGILNIFEGSQVTTNSISLGARHGSFFYWDGSGFANVIGEGSILNTGSLRIGTRGYGKLTVEDMGRVIADNILADDDIVLDRGYVESPKITLQNGSISGGGWIVGSVNSLGGKIAPNGLHILESLTLDENSRFDVNLEDAFSATESLIHVEGQVSLAGALNLTTDEEFVPTAGTEFEIVSSAHDILGRFDRNASSLQMTNPNFAWHVKYHPSKVALKVLDVSWGDFNHDAGLGNDDLDSLIVQISGEKQANYDTNRDGEVNEDDLTTWVKDLKQTWFGDANLDGEFNSRDLVEVFVHGVYESGLPADWSQGDWNGDRRFNSSDLVSAFEDGGYEIRSSAEAAAIVPEPSVSIALVLLLLCVSLDAKGIRTGVLTRVRSVG